jgi:hypothetical protein
VWLAGFSCFVIALIYYGVEKTLGSFALFSCLLGSFVFNFELGRLMGFLKSHVPSLHSQLPHSWWFDFNAFFNPGLFSTPETSAPHYCAIQIYRAAWRFSAVALFLPLLIKWGNAVIAYVL